MEHRRAAHRRADAVDALAGEPFVEEQQQVFGEVGPAIVLRDGAAGGVAVAAGVVAQQPRAVQAPAEVEVEQPIARPARRQAMELDDGMAAFIAELRGQLRAGHGESGRDGDGGRRVFRSIGARHDFPSFPVCFRRVSI